MKLNHKSNTWKNSKDKKNFKKELLELIKELIHNADLALTLEAYYMLGKLVKEAVSNITSPEDKKAARRSAIKISTELRQLSTNGVSEDIVIPNILLIHKNSIEKEQRNQRNNPEYRLGSEDEPPIKNRRITMRGILLVFGIVWCKVYPFCIPEREE